MPMPAHPSSLPARDADDESVVGYISGHYRTGGDEAVAAKRDATDYGSVGADGRAAFYKSLFI